MTFIILALVFMIVGRRLGWVLSRTLLYASSLVVAIVVSLCWGMFVAFVIKELVNWQHPGVTLQWAMGYALGAYVAIPNFGLFDKSTIREGETRHILISNLPLFTYILVSIGLAFSYGYLACSIAGIVILSLAARICLTALERSHKSLLAAATFAVVAIGAYSASFVVDMLMLVWSGELPLGNVVLPCTTWSIISTGALTVGATPAVPTMIRLLPFLMLGGVAMLAAAVHARNIVHALVLIIGGLAYAWTVRSTCQSARAGSGRPSR